MSTRQHRHLYTLGINPPEVEEMMQLGVQKGHFMTAMKEPALPSLAVLGDETIISNHCGSYIRLSRDNLGHAAHGNGGSGGTDCAAIYMCAGLLSGAGDKRKKSKGEKIKTGPNTALDGASLYLTQRGDIDKYFALPKGKHRLTDNFSGAILKSDHTRLVGRESVKIYAGKGYYQGTGYFGEPNSQGGDITHQGSIDLIVGSSDDLQPVVKGDNLRECLVEIIDMIRDLASVMVTSHKYSSAAWFSVASLPSPVTFGPSLTMGLHDAISSIDDILRGLTCEFVKMNYLGLGYKDEMIMEGGKDLITGDTSYILSHHVHTT